MNPGNSLTVIHRPLVPVRHVPPVCSFPDQLVARFRVIRAADRLALFLADRQRGSDPLAFEPALPFRGRGTAPLAKVIDLLVY